MTDGLYQILTRPSLRGVFVELNDGRYRESLRSFRSVEEMRRAVGGPRWLGWFRVVSVDRVPTQQGAFQILLEMESGRRVVRAFECVRRVEPALIEL